MTINCYLVDDELHALEVLTRYIANTPGLELTGAEENPLQALRALTSGSASADITFLDVDMPQLSGVELAGLISGHTTIIFTTAFPTYAMQAFEKDAVDYLLKPISYERFLRAISKARQKIQSRQKEQPQSVSDAGHFFIKSDVKGKLLRIDIDAIYYVEAQQNYVRIHTLDSAHTTYLTMTELEEHLPATSFARVHKSFIVNHEKVRAVEGNQILLDLGHVVQLGASYRAEFLERINARLVKSKRNN